MRNSDFIFTQRDSLIEEEISDTSADVLSKREKEIAALLACGKSNKEIANFLFISVRTVETHRKTIFRKLEIHSLAPLVLYAVRHELVAI